jgi:hypothetical protein
VNASALDLAPIGVNLQNALRATADEADWADFADTFSHFLPVQRGRDDGTLSAKTERPAARARTGRFEQTAALRA